MDIPNMQLTHFSLRDCHSQFLCTPLQSFWQMFDVSA